MKKRLPTSEDVRGIMGPEVGTDYERIRAERDRLAARVKVLEAVVEASPVLMRLRDQIVNYFDAPEDTAELEAFFAALDAGKAT